MNELSNKYQFTVRQLQYMSLIDAIPSTWKFSYKKNVISCNTKLNKAKGKSIVGEMVDKVNCLKSATVYQILIQRLNIVPTAEEKWVEEFPALNQIHFKNFYILPYKTVSDSKIHVFQYKLLHRILACKHNLFKWKIIDNDKRTHCNEIKTIEHLFYNCSQAKSFITQIEYWINRTYGKHFLLLTFYLVFQPQDWINS